MKPGQIITKDLVTIIAAKPSQDQFIVLGLWNDITPYAVWTYDPRLDCLWMGHYFRDLPEAVECFERKA